MAMAHTACDGIHLEQDPKSGNWKVVSVLSKPSLWSRARGLRIFKNGWIRTGLACVVGAVVAMAFNHISPFNKAAPLPIAIAPQPEPIQPRSISLAQSSYAIEATDPSSLPPPIVVLSAAEEGISKSLADAAIPAASAASATSEAVALVHKTPAQTGPAPVQAGANTPAAKAAPIVQPLQPPAPVRAAAPLLPPAKLVATVPAPLPKAPPAQQVAAAATAKQSQPAGQDDGKLAVFNEPLQLAKPTQAPTLPPVVATAAQSQSQPGNKAQPPKNGIRMLAVQSATAIVVTNPTTRLPMVVKIGDQLPDGSVLKSIDKSASSAMSSRGDSIVLQ